MVEQLKAKYGDDNVAVEWLPYLLRPDMPEDGQPPPAYVRQKRDQFEGRLKAMAGPAKAGTPNGWAQVLT